VQIFLASLPLPAVSATLTANEAEIERLTNLILHKEIDLERYYLLYRVHGTKEPKYRRLRYYLLQVGSASCTLASNIMFLKLAKDSLRPPGVSDFGRADAEANEEVGTIEEPEVSTVNFLRNAYYLAMVGLLLDAGSSCIELASNSFTAIKNIRQKQSPAAAVKNVEARLKEIDSLMAERTKLVLLQEKTSTRAIHEAENKVLVSFRNWCLSEFADVYADVKSAQSSNNIYYLLDVAADSVYVAGMLVGFRALHPGKEYLNGPSLNVSIVGDAIAVASVPLSTMSGSKLYKFYRNRLMKKLEKVVEDAEDQTKNSMTNFKKEIDAAPLSSLESAGSALPRMKAYLIWSERYDEVIEKSITELKHQAKVALQGTISGPTISASYLAADILSHVGFYQFANKPSTAASLAFASSITATTGTSASLFLTNYNLISETLHRRKLRKQGLLPEQLLAERLKVLDELDTFLIGLNPK